MGRWSRPRKENLPRPSGGKEYYFSFLFLALSYSYNYTQQKSLGSGGGVGNCIYKKWNSCSWTIVTRSKFRKGVDFTYEDVGFGEVWSWLPTTPWYPFLLSFSTRAMPLPTGSIVLAGHRPSSLRLHFPASFAAMGCPPKFQWDLTGNKCCFL